MVLALFIISLVPAALADNDNGNGQNGVPASELSDSDADDGSAEQTDDSLEPTPDREQLREHAPTLKKVTAQQYQEMRELTKQKMNDLKEQYQQAKESYGKLKEQYQEKRQLLVEANERVKVCQNAESEDCLQAKTELKNGVKQHLLNTNDLIDNSLERLRNRIEASTSLTEEEVSTTTASLEALEEKLTVERENVAALQAEGATNAELKDAIKNLKSVWQEVRTEQRSVISNLVSSKMVALEAKAAGYSEQLDEKIAELSAAGEDVAELERLRATYQEKVAAMEQHRENLDDAKESLNEVRESLRQFMLKYNEQKQTSVGTTAEE